MITYQAVVGGLSFLGVFQPFVALFHNLVFLEIEVSADYGLETFGRVFDVLKHSEFYVTVSDDVSIGFIFLLALRSSLLVLKSWLIEVNVLAHDDGLN